MKRFVFGFLTVLMSCLTWNISAQDIYIGEPKLKNNYVSQIPLGKVGSYIYSICLSPKQNTFIKYNSSLEQVNSFAISSLDDKNVRFLKGYVYNDLIYLLKWEREDVNTFSVDVFDENFEMKGTQVIAEIDVAAKDLSFYIDPLQNKVVFHYFHSDNLHLFHADINSFNKFESIVSAKGYNVKNFIYTESELYIVSSTESKLFQNKDSIQVREIDLQTQEIKTASIPSFKNHEYVHMEYHPSIQKLVGGYFKVEKGVLIFNELMYDGDLTAKEVLVDQASDFSDKESILTQSIIPRSDGGYLVQGELFSTEQRVTRSSPFDGGGVSAISTLENYQDLLVINIDSLSEVDIYKVFPKSQQVVSSQRDIASFFTWKTPSAIYALYNDLYSLSSTILNTRITNVDSHKIQSIQMSRGEYIDITNGIQISHDEVLFPMLGQQKKIILLSF